MQLKKPLQYLIVYTLWIAFLLLGVWFMFLGQSVLNLFAALNYVDEIYTKATVVRFLDRSFIFIVIIILMALSVIIEEYFRRGIQQEKVFHRITLVFGIEFIVLFAFDLILLALQSWHSAPERYLILAVELILGVGLLLYRRRIIIPKSA